MRHAKSLKCFPVVIVVIIIIIIIIVIIIIIIIIIIINIYLIRLFFLSCLAHVCVFVGNSNQGRGGSNEQTLHKGWWPFYVRSVGWFPASSTSCLFSRAFHLCLVSRTQWQTGTSMFSRAFLLLHVSRP